MGGDAHASGPAVAETNGHRGATDLLVERVRGVIATRRIDPSDRAQVADIAAEALEGYRRQAAVGANTPLGNAGEVLGRVVRMVCEFGAATEAIANPEVEEVFFEDDRITTLVSGRLRGIVEPTTLDENRHVIDRLLGETSVSLTPANPLVQAQVLGGRARLTAAGPPVVDGLSATLRKYVERRVRMDRFVELDSVSAAAANFMRLVMRVPGSVVISGPPGAGKTTTASAFLSAVHPNHCVRVLEEYPELYLPNPHGRCYRCKPPDPEGKGAVTLRDLVKFVLGMRADIIAIGEVRSAEAWELTRAARAGAGFLTTLHASSASDALEALVTASLAAPEANEAHVRKSFASSIDVVCHVERDDPNLLSDGDPYRRQVTEIRTMAPQMEGDQFSTDLLFVRKGGLGTPMTWNGELPATALVDRLERLLPRRVRLRDVLTGRAGLE